MSRRAVVLGGGGARGPYHIGVWQALNELAIDFQIVTGTSVGAINGAFFVQQEFETAKSMWEKLTTYDVIAEIPDEQTLESRKSLALINFFKQSVERGGMDVTPLENILRSAINESAVRASPIEFGLVTTRVPEIKPVNLLKSDIPEGELVDYILASAACFPFFQQRDIDGKRYIDGAYSDNVPADFAVSCGAEEIIAVDLRGLGIIHSYRHEEVPVTYIRSHWDLGEMFIFDIQKTKRNMRLGYQDAMKTYRRLEGKSYAFYLNETHRNATALRSAFDMIRKRTSVDLFRQYELLPKSFEGLSLLDHLFVKPGNQRYTLGHSVTTAAEITAELLNIPPDHIYTFGAFNHLIYEKSAYLRATARELHLLEKTHPRYMLKNIYKLLKRAYQNKELPERFWGLAALAPKSFVAAYYILAIEVYSANL